MKNRQQGSAAVVVLILILLALLGLAFWWVWDQNKDKEDDDNGDEPTSLSISGVGFMTPESVLYDPVDDVYLVSNINGQPLGKDDNGFISRVGPDGNVIQLKWIDGAAGDFDLNAPKGMAISGDELYIADIDTVRVYNRSTGEFVRNVAISDTTFLNGVAAGTTDGTVFVSDSGLDASFASTGTDAIYKITGGDQVETLIANTTLANPNGIAVHSDGEQLMVASFGSKKIFHINADGSIGNTLETPEGSLDGLVWQTIDSTMLASSWDADAVYRVDHATGNSTVVVENVTDPADLGYDTKRSRVLIPLFNDDAVEVRTIN